MHTTKEKKSLFPMGFVAFLVILGLLLSVVTVRLIKQIYLSEKHLVPLGILMLLVGLIYEFKKICEKWKTVLLTILVAYGLSFSAIVFPINPRHYVLEDRIEAWPYVFCFWFVLIAVIIHERKTTPRSNEGITLLQSVAMIYWGIDAQIYTSPSWFMKCLMGLGILFSLNSLLHAFTYIKLSRVNRFWLSFWSSIVMLVFSFENIISLHKNEELVETANSIPAMILILAKYFFLGISCVYMARNYIMLAGFLPGRGTFFNNEYFQDLKDLKKQHIERYSREQIKILYSFITLIISAAIFTLNFYYNWMPRNLIIWVVFLIFSLLIHFVDNGVLKPKLKVRTRPIIFRRDMEEVER